MGWKNAIVALYVPTEENGVYGTAFAVGDDILLTARHVVRPERRNTTKRIRVKWWHSAIDKADTQGWEEAALDDQLII
jgi:V8-like Glu-specific endopeptidase